MQRIIIATLAVAAVSFSTMAHGQFIDREVRLDEPDPAYTVKISVETLSNASSKSITVDDETFYAAPDNGLLTYTRVGIRGADGRQVFIRFDLENSVFFNLSPTGHLIATPPQKNLAAEAGGDDGQTWIVLSAPANSTFPDHHWVQFNLFMAVRPDKSAKIIYSTYLNLSDALQRRSPIVTKTKTAVIPERSLTDEVTPRVLTATVTSDFTQLATAGTNTIGTLAINLNSGVRWETHYSALSSERFSRLRRVGDFGDFARAGNVAAGTGSLITFRGDFSVGTFYANNAAAASCGSTPLTTRANNAVIDKVTIAAAEGVSSLCIDVPEANTAEIPEGEYTVEVDYEGLANAAFPPEDIAETPIGRIRRDGTRVQIPFLTTYSGYRQRVVIVNRNTKPVSYAFKFIAEDGVTATPGEVAAGTLPAQDRVVLRTTDIVTLEGGKTRTAATLDVVAANGTVDVATTTMNMADQGTDTVVLETVAN